MISSKVHFHKWLQQQPLQYTMLLSNISHVKMYHDGNCNQLWQRMSELYAGYGLYSLNHDKVVIKYRM